MIWGMAKHNLAYQGVITLEKLNLLEDFWYDGRSFFVAFKKNNDNVNVGMHRPCLRRVALKYQKKTPLRKPIKMSGITHTDVLLIRQILILMVYSASSF